MSWASDPRFHGLSYTLIKLHNVFMCLAVKGFERGVPLNTTYIMHQFMGNNKVDLLQAWGWDLILVVQQVSLSVCYQSPVFCGSWRVIWDCYLVWVKKYTVKVRKSLPLLYYTPKVILSTTMHVLRFSIASMWVEAISGYVSLILFTMYYKKELLCYTVSKVCGFSLNILK